MTPVRLERITKVFGATRVLRNITLDIRKGELFFLLGPSGCGKSTLLRLIAGLHEPSGGQIWFGDREVTHLPTEQRNAVMCFQSYALWPHMTVRDNLRFGLAVRKMQRLAQDERIEKMLALVQMSDLAERKPNQLSGGQQQRVALARALAVEPDCLLLDEPLSNLDAKLRHDMRAEIRKICKKAGCTTVYVTHDQKEALSVADRIAVMREGNIEQVGTPAELYDQPRTAFVAGFIGQTNLLKGTIVQRLPGMARVQTGAGLITVATKSELPDKVIVSLRPEQMRIARRASDDSGLDFGVRDANRLVGALVETTFLGDSSEHVLEINSERLKVIATPPLKEAPEEVAVEFGPRDGVVLPA